MNYRSGIWLYIQTNDDDVIEYIPLSKVLKQDLKISLSQILEKLKNKVQQLKVVLIDFSKETFLSKLNQDLVAKTTVVLRKKECQIYFDKQTKKVKVSKEKDTKIRTLIVDDSTTMRVLIRKILECDPNFEVVAEAGHPSQALELIEKNDYDLITMDLHLPEMTGSDLIKTYFKKKSIPTVVISSLRPEESELVLESLENGAVDYIQKPSQQEISSVKEEIIQRLLVAARAQTGKIKSVVNNKLNFKGQKGLLAIGASTGGTEAIKNVLQQVGEHIPPTVIVQHIPPVFSKAFADRLNKILPFEVKEAEDGDVVKADRVLIAPGGCQMKLVRKGTDYVVNITDAPPMNRHKPSVDYLFDSIAENYKGSLVGVLLTGMGADGANGLLKLRKTGAYTIAQDESTSVVFGMPREAILRGGAIDVKELYNIGEAIFKGFSLNV